MEFFKFFFFFLSFELFLLQMEWGQLSGERQRVPHTTSVGIMFPVWRWDFCFLNYGLGFSFPWVLQLMIGTVIMFCYYWIFWQLIFNWLLWHCLLALSAGCFFFSFSWNTASDLTEKSFVVNFTSTFEFCNLSPCEKVLAVAWGYVGTQ